MSSRGQSIVDAYPVQKFPMQKETNNIYKEFPPLMNDGRVLTSWQPGESINRKIMESAGITTNWNYRKYLMQNSEDIRNENLTLALNDTGYFSRAQVPSIPESLSDLEVTYLTRQELNAKRVIPVMTQEELVRRWGK